MVRKAGSPRRAVATAKAPPAQLLAKIARFKSYKHDGSGNVELSDAYRELLRTFLSTVEQQASPSASWKRAVREALDFLGGQPDRGQMSLAQYDHRRYGPFLGISDEGAAAQEIRRAAFASPKALALGRLLSPLTIGVGLDAEILGGVGEVPVGPDEFSQVWSECVGRLLMTTNVGSRANLRFYLRPPLVTIAEKDRAAAIVAARADVTAAFKAFLEAPGGPRPLTVSVEFVGGSGYSESQRRSILSDLRDFVETLPHAQPQLHTIALNAEIGQQEQGRDDAKRAIETASGAGLRLVTIDGIVRKDADRLISLPGLLEYLTPDLVDHVLAFAHERGITVRPINHVDADTVARETWISLTTARAMGLNLGKYGLFPLTLEQCDIVIGRIQGWIKGWGAAPVFYADQGIVSEGNVYVGPKLIAGIKAWLDVLRKHGVSLCLIDTVDKAAGWKILKSDKDPKGLLEIAQVRELSEYGFKAGINILWAGGITPQQAYQFGQLGVFGIYVTTAASVAAPVTDEYRDDPGLAVEKHPTYAGVMLVKTLLEAGFLGQPVNVADHDLARREAERLQKLLPAAWQALWKSSQRGRKAPVGGRA